MNRIIPLIALTALLAPVVHGADSNDRKATGKGSKKTTSAPANPNKSGNQAKPVKSTAASKASGKPSSKVDMDGVSQASAKPSGSRVKQASHAGVIQEAEVIHDGEVIHEGGIVHEGMAHGSSCGCESCGEASSCIDGSCDIGCCDECLQPRRLCICLPAHGWAQMDYLMWWGNDMAIPPLVLSGTARVPVLGQGDAAVQLGDGNAAGRSTLFDERRAGGRIRFGWWLSNFPGLGVQGEYFGLGSETEQYVFNQNNPAGTNYSIPYINFVDRSDIGLPVGVESATAVESARFLAKNQVDGASFHFRKNLFSEGGSASGLFGRDCIPTCRKMDALVGYRYMQLEESIQGTYSHALPQQTFNAVDLFHTRNQFNGPDFGFNYQKRRGLWSADFLMRVAVGNVRQQVDISGSTTIQNNANGAIALQTNQSGLFASRTTITNSPYIQNQMAVIPELGATIGYQLTPRLRLTTGYTFLYYSRVLRPGDQIDRNINPTNITVLSGQAPTSVFPDRPQFSFKQTDYWLQGLNLGAEYRW